MDFYRGFGSIMVLKDLGLLLSQQDQVIPKQIEIMRDFGTTSFTSTPSYAIYLGEALEEMKIDPKKDLKLKIGVFGAEPWGKGMRQRIEELFNIDAYDNYGISELCGPGVAVECIEKDGLHVWEDHFIMEVIDPKTGETLGEGERGELVFTPIWKEAMPLLDTELKIYHEYMRINVTGLPFRKSKDFMEEVMTCLS